MSWQFGQMLAHDGSSVDLNALCVVAELGGDRNDK